MPVAESVLETELPGAASGAVSSPAIGEDRQLAGPGVARRAFGAPPLLDGLSVSNSSSRCHGELHEPPAVRDPAHLVELGTSPRMSAGET